MSNEASPRGRVRWSLIGCMFAISAIAYLDRVNISIAGQSLQKEFHLDNIQLGWVFSAFLLGYAAFQTPGGWLADRFGPRRTVALGTIWWGVFTALTALMPSGFGGALAMLLAVRLALGVGEAVLYPASNRMVASWIPSQERGVANGVIFAGVGAGGAITPPLITFILLSYGWRWSFYVCALIGLAAGVVWYWIARDKPEEHPRVNQEELAHIRAGLPQQPLGSSSRPAVPWGSIFSSREVLALTFSYFAFCYEHYIFYTWFFIYLSKVRGLDLRSSSYYSMLPFLTMATCSLLGGWIGDRLTKRYGKRVGRCGLAGAGFGFASLLLALGTQATDARLTTIVMAASAGALFLSTSSFWSVTADVGASFAGTISGIMNTGGQIAGAITASLTPCIAGQLGWTASFLVAAVLCALGALAWLFVDPERVLVRTHQAAEEPV